MGGVTNGHSQLGHGLKLVTQALKGIRIFVNILIENTEKENVNVDMGVGAEAGKQRQT